MNPKIIFFMIITDPDIHIADYAIRSYGKISGLDFRLRIYSNYISPAFKEKYFKKWLQFGFVDLIRNDHQDISAKPSGADLKGPFERPEDIWDRELRKIQAPFHAQADADFEILNPKFIYAMLARLETEPRLIAIGTSGHLQPKTVFDTYSQETIIANPRLGTSFCIYKKAALDCTVSHRFYEEINETGPVKRNTWDCSGYFQRFLTEELNYKIEILEPEYKFDFIHYGAFSKNQQLNEKNIGFYRHIQIIRKVGLLGFRPARRAGRLMNNLFFRQIDRSQYLDGYKG